jgi:hypothetical protein
MIKSYKHAADPLLYGICFSGLCIVKYAICVSVAWEDMCAPSRYVCWPGVGHSVN